MGEELAEKRGGDLDLQWPDIFITRHKIKSSMPDFFKK